MKLLSLLIICSFLCSCKKQPESENANSGAESNFIHYVNFESAYIRSRNVDVWLPDGYTETEKYQVLYMHDGQNIINAETSYGGQSWEVDKAISKLINDKKIAPTIVIGVWNTKDRTIEYTPKKPYQSLSHSFKQVLTEESRITKQPESDNYLKFLVEELKPFIDKTYATKKEQTYTFIAGSSMGGLISLYAMTEYPETFGGAGCISTHWPLSLKENHEQFRTSYQEYLKENAQKLSNHKLYFDYGTETLDAWYEPHQIAIDSMFYDQNVPSLNYMSVKVQGAEHNEVWWRKRFSRIAEFLLANN